MINLTREEAQQVLDALEGDPLEMVMNAEGHMEFAKDKATETLRARLSEPENEFNPDWNAMAVMVEEQQRMAKQIEELDIALAEQDAKYLDAVETLDDEGWTWDGDQWQRPATRSEKLREARITRRPRGWSKEDEPEPVAWLITDEMINSLQVDSIQRLIDRARHAHMTDIKLRINGQDEWHQADWIKHMKRAAPPQRKEWVGLTAKDLAQILPEHIGGAIWADARLKEKNT